MIRSALHADQVPHSDPHAGDQRLQHRAARRTFKIFDDVRLDAGVADQSERAGGNPHQPGLRRMTLIYPDLEAAAVALILPCSSKRVTASAG
jgi:hypothetical protein